MREKQPRHRARGAEGSVSGEIRLHPKLGLNPHMTYCPRCGGEGRDLILLGARDYIDKCCDCGIMLIGGGPCPKHPGRRTERVRSIEEHEKLPGSACEACEKDLAAQEAEVAAGGVYFRCDCGAKGGVILAQHALAADARAQLKIAAPAPCGVSIPECPSCAKEPRAT